MYMSKAMDTTIAIIVAARYIMPCINLLSIRQHVSVFLMDEQLDIMLRLA